jgi:2-dehydropantoate 2-reductase
MGGLCFICVNRTAPGVIHHTAYGAIILGEFQRPPGPRTHELAALFRNAGVNCKVTENLARSHWEKLVWNIPFNGLGVAGVAGREALENSKSEIQNPNPAGACLTTDKLLGDTRWERLVRELMLEVIAGAAALGFVIPASFAEKQIERTRTMGAYKASTLIDFELGRALELENLFLEPLGQAQRAGAAVPRLEALCRVLRQLEAARARSAES